jgi:hypothetical protein
VRGPLVRHCGSERRERYHRAVIQKISCRQKIEIWSLPTIHGNKLPQDTVVTTFVHAIVKFERPSTLSSSNTAVCVCFPIVFRREFNYRLFYYHHSTPRIRFNRWSSFQRRGSLSWFFSELKAGAKKRSCAMVDLLKCVCARVFSFEPYLYTVQ